MFGSVPSVFYFFNFKKVNRLQICVLYYMNIKYIFFSQDPLSVLLFN